MHMLINIRSSRFSPAGTCKILELSRLHGYSRHALLDVELQWNIDGREPRN